MELIPLQKKQILPILFIFALLVILSLIIILGQFFHQTLQDEMAEQFNKQQLMLAREVSVNIDSFIDRVYKDIHTIAQLPQIHIINQSTRCRIVAEAITSQLKDDVPVAVQVLTKKGKIIYDSTASQHEREDRSKTDFFRKARLLRKQERLIIDLPDVENDRTDIKRFMVATPIFQHLSSPVLEEFNGIVLAIISMDDITKKYLSPIKSGARGYAWMMDSTGTLLYHPTRPDMVGKKIYRADQTCFRCHTSFNTEKKMIEGGAETSGGYRAPGGENKLLAFYRIPIENKSWFVVVSAPYSEVTALMQESMRFYSLLIISIFVTTLAVSGATIVIYKKKIKAEERTRHLENQRRLEREIELAKNYLENILENTQTSLMVLDRELNVKTVNTAQAQTLGRPKEDILDKPFFSLFPDNLQPYDGMPIETILHKTLTGISYELKDYKITGLQKAPIYLDMIISPLTLGGSVTGILITSNDETKRFHLEEALKLYAAELEHKVDRGTATAKQLEQQVLHSEKLASLGRLAAGVAHEIGNPLTSISTFAQLLREMATDEFSQSSLDIINNHIQRITDIVRQMSAFSRPDSTNMKYAQLNEILNSSLDLMRLDKRMKSTIEITVGLDPNLPKTMIDEGQISQVFINIILNALDAMPDSGSLRVSSRFERSDEGPGSIVIKIADTGIGIPVQDIQKIFDPFYTTKEAGKGTGLGLAISYNIIKRYHGDIKVESAVGHGTTFTIMLPVQAEQA